MGLTRVLRNAPWEIYYDALEIVKKEYADKELPDDRPALLIKGSSDTLEKELRARENFEAAKYEYYIKGQEWGLRRASNILDEGYYAELHARAFVQSRGLLILPHWEPSRYEEGSAHMSSDYVYYDEGCKRMRKVLEDLKYSPTRVRT